MIENVSMKPSSFEPIRKNHFVCKVGKIDPNLIKSVTYDPIHKNIVVTFYEATDSVDIVKEFMRIKEKNRTINCTLSIIDALGNIKKKTTFRKCSVRNVKTSGFEYASDDLCETLVIFDYETVTFGKGKGKIKATQTYSILNTMPRPVPHGASSTVETEESYENTAIGQAMLRAKHGEKWQDEE